MIMINLIFLKDLTVNCEIFREVLLDISCRRDLTMVKIFPFQWAMGTETFKKNHLMVCNLTEDLKS